MYSIKYTLGGLRETVLKLLQKYSSNGSVYSGGEKADIENRLVTSLNIHLTRLWNEFPGNTQRCGISFFAPVCAADFGDFTVACGESLVKSEFVKNAGFCMTVSGKGRLLAEAGGITREYYADTEKGERIMIRGAVGNGTECECRFTLTADTRLYVYGFTVYEEVCTENGESGLLYGRDVCAAYLPKDCSEILAVYESDGRREKRTAYKVLEDERVLLIGRGGSAEHIIEYVPYPPACSEEEGDNSEVMIPPLMADALGYMCAADLCPVEEPELYSRLTYKYREVLENLYSRHRRSSIVNRFYGFIGKRGVFHGVNGGGRYGT